MQKTVPRKLMTPAKNFTLIELLVVISIIAILAAMLLPALNQARNSARAADCLSQQKQIGVAISAYIDDWEGYFPGTPVGAVRQRQLAVYLDAPLVHPYDKPKVWWCPADTYRYNLFRESGSTFLFQSYGVNYYLRFDAPTPKKFNTVRNPSQVLQQLDSYRENGVHVTFVATSYPFTPDAELDKGVDFRHSGSANLLFCDGHVDSAKRADLVTQYKMVDGY